MARHISYGAIQFMSFDQYKLILTEQSNIPLLYSTFLAGSLAGVTGQTVTYPLDRARAVMAVTKVADYRNMKVVFSRSVKEEGYLSLYRGITPNLLGIVLYSGVGFCTFEHLKLVWSKGNEYGPSLPLRFISGAIAGLLGQFVAYPLDTVRRRMQTATQMGVHANRYSSILGTLVYIFQKEGILRGWYKGISMNFIRAPITNGISFTVNDYCKLAFRWLQGE